MWEELLIQELAPVIPREKQACCEHDDVCSTDVRPACRLDLTANQGRCMLGLQSIEVLAAEPPEPRPAAVARGLLSVSQRAAQHGVVAGMW